MNILLRQMKITALKVSIAKLLYKVTKIFYRKDVYPKKIGNINLELHLNEGIDLHLFLFSNFQKHVFDNEIVQIKKDAVIFDVGANAGYLTLFFADMVTNGHVHAFEPTHYAIQKLVKNASLNPELKKRITVNQCFVSDQDNQKDLVAYSSWPLTGNESTHSIHKGVAKSTEDVTSITLDSYCDKHSIDRLDLIKIDTDGHEFDVLTGAQNVIKRFQPQIVFEVGGYILDEQNTPFEGFIDFFNDLGYKIYTIKGKVIERSNFKNIIPQYGTIDVIASK
ncbi:MAG: FkbM family methyltransferase [Chitinophagales bacterium]